MWFLHSVSSQVSKPAVCSGPLRLLQLQWKQDVDLGLELISKAIEIDNKCDFAYETMGTIEVQRSEPKDSSTPCPWTLGAVADLQMT